jgi:anti-sigma factor RsiW
MVNEKWLIQLEAFLDGELSADQEQDFRERLKSNPELQAELLARQEDRALFRQTLGEDVGNIPLEMGDIQNTEPRRMTRRADGRGRTIRMIPWRNVGLGLTALAASVALLLLIPWQSRDENGVAGPRSTITVSGQVVAARYGEEPGQTVVLETGAADFSAGNGQQVEGM